MTLFYVLFLPALISLGFWQLARGAEKRQLETDYLTQLTALPVPVAQLNVAQRFQRVRLTGRYGNEMYLLDNQVVEGVTGYWVVQVFNEKNGKRYLANRGFWPGGRLRSELPQIPTPSETVSLVGVVWPFTGLLPVLDDDVWPAGWPKRVQRLDINRMADVADTQAFEIRLEAGQPGVQTAAPFAPVLSDAKHNGYAATWFGLAVVLSVGFLVFGFKNPRGEQV